MRRWLGVSFLPFMAGMVTAFNLVNLLGHNAAYEAAWWKVALAVGAAIVGSIAWRKA